MSVDAGADASLKNKQGFTAREIGREYGHLHVVRAIDAAEQGNADKNPMYNDTPLHAAIREKDEPRARGLISHTSHKTLCLDDSLEQRPVHLAAALGMSELY